MKVIIQEPGGPRAAVTPREGFRSAAALLRSMAMTLAGECDFCVNDVTLCVNLSGVMPEELRELARILAEIDGGEEEPTTTH